MKIFVINPGSTSTKIALFEDDQKVWGTNVDHAAEELKKFKETDISKSYGINWIPSIVVVDKEGKVLLSTVLSNKVDQLLKELTE